jgi:putative transposase
VYANRFEALEPIRQGIRAHFGNYDKEVAVGLTIRHDHGSQYLSRYFQSELNFLGAKSSPSFIRCPEGNGVAERMVRTLKEQCLWLRQWKTLEELQLALIEFKERYNNGWLVQKHGYKTPLEIRKRMMKLAA